MQSSYHWSNLECHQNALQCHQSDIGVPLVSFRMFLNDLECHYSDCETAEVTKNFTIVTSNLTNETFDYHCSDLKMSPQRPKLSRQ